MQALPSSLTLFGAGKMGAALLEGWLKAGLNPHGVALIEPHPSKAIKDLCTAKGMVLNDTTRMGPADVLVLAIKPQMLDQVAQKANALIGPQTLVISILAGKRISDLAQRLPRAKGLIRAMPNLPASIGKGATGAFASADVTTDQKAMSDTLLATSGYVAWLEKEALLDAVTALSGSGPAYLFALVEAMQQAGEALGLSPALAEALAKETLFGSAALIQQSSQSASALRQAVTSPGGTTEAALSHLQGPEGLPSLLQKAMQAACQRAGELSG